MDLSRTNLSLRRPLSDYSKVQAFYGQLVRGRRFQLRRLAAHSYLNVGCGQRSLIRFTNVDYLWTPGLDLCWDITTGLPFSDGRFVGIYSEHCLEHLHRDISLRVLKDFRRMLAPGGAVRIVVPDVELYIDLYVRARAGENVQFPYETNGCLRVEPLNRIFRDHGHLFAYDFQAMEALLRSAGFTTVRKMCFMDSGDPNLLVDSPEREVESLYVEAQ